VAATIGYGASATFDSTPSASPVIKDFAVLAPLSGSLSLLTTSRPPSGDGAVQLARRVRTQEIAVGPALALFQWNSGTHPLVANGPGVLWLFELGASDSPLAAPPTVWRISDRSGAVLQKTTVPPLLRPLLAADKSGLYLAGAGSFGGVGHGLIFHVGVGAKSAVTVLGTGSVPASLEFVGSLTAGNGKVVAAVCTRPAGSVCPTTVLAERA
jgi:hypothetical protein